MIKGFKEFILRGNVIDLAVAVVIGAAFTGIVNAVVTSVFNPLIGALFNSTTLAKALPVDIPAIGGGTPAVLYFGAVIAAVIQFVLVAVVVYFALVVPINYLKKISFERQKQDQDATPADVPPTETELLIQIRDLLAGTPSPEGDHTLGKHVE
jgi:large conductance mechanosensitive channel